MVSGLKSQRLMVYSTGRRRLALAAALLGGVVGQIMDRRSRGATGTFGYQRTHRVEFAETHEPIFGLQCT